MWIDFKHLKKADQKYLPHAFRAILISVNLFCLSIAALIHAILPFVLLETVSTGIEKLSNQIKKFTKL